MCVHVDAEMGLQNSKKIKPQYSTRVVGKMYNSRNTGVIVHHYICRYSLWDDGSLHV